MFVLLLILLWFPKKKYMLNIHLLKSSKLVRQVEAKVDSTLVCTLDVEAMVAFRS